MLYFIMNLLRSSSQVALAFIVCSLCLGCESPFRQFYRGTTVLEANAVRQYVLAPDREPTVLTTDNVALATIQHIEDGWSQLGSASWTGPDVGTESQAREQAKLVGATLVIWSWRYEGSSSGVLPMVTPTTTTTYSDGSVYGTAGTATWSGTTTTYGSRTTYIPYTVHRYTVESSFLARATPPTFGAYVQRLTPAQETRSGTTEGVAITIVIKGSPASRAGLVPNDVICRIDSNVIATVDDFQRCLDTSHGKTVNVDFIRDGVRQTKQFELNR